MIPASNYANKKTASDSYSTNSSEKSITDGGIALANHIKEDTMEIAGSVAAEGQKKVNDLKSYAGECMKSLEKEVSNNPVQSVAIAFATGAFFSILMGRR